MRCLRQSSDQGIDKELKTFNNDLLLKFGQLSLVFDINDLKNFTFFHVCFDFAPDELFCFNETLIDRRN